MCVITRKVEIFPALSASIFMPQRFGGISFVLFLYFFSIQQKLLTFFVSVSSLLHLCHTLPAKKDLKKTVEFDIGFAIARIWSTASNSMNSLNTANLMEIYTVCKLCMSALCAKKVQTFTFVLMLWSFYTGGLKYYRVSHSKVNKVLLVWWGYKFWFLLILISWDRAIYV